MPKEIPLEEAEGRMDFLNQYEASDFTDDSLLVQYIAAQRAMSAAYEAGVKPARYGSKLSTEDLAKKLGFKLKPQPEPRYLTPHWKKFKKTEE